uniref:Mex-3 RNA binding family member D n=1 Tax=Myotis lucifugus TaxID=59463 RepID=G1PVX0_MYOLU
QTDLGRGPGPHHVPLPPNPGCKIKALRAKTNTYIKTPVRGEEPVFIVTGRQEDVEMAKREILSAAEHFSVIRATRSKAGGLPGTAQGPPNLPGQTTIQVRVPYRVVGLVVGPKGATIKRIQQRTHTYIVTPGRDKEPVFAVTGMPENVDRAREEIEAHITLRTGAFTDAGPDSDFHANGTDVCLDLLGAAAGLWAKAPNPGRRPTLPSASLRGDSTLGAPGGPEAFYPSSNGGFTFGGDGPGAPTGPPAPEDCDFGFDFLALDLTVPAAATIWAPFERPSSTGPPAPPAPGVRRSSGAGTPRHSPTLPEPGGLGLELPLARRGPPDPVGALPWRPPQGSLSSFSSSSSFSTATSLPSSSSASTCSPLDSSASEPGPALVRECVVCAEGEVMAALVPCGHNLFCMDCAVRICGKSEPECPACRTPATQAIHIFS